MASSEQLLISSRISHLHDLGMLADSQSAAIACDAPDL